MTYKDGALEHAAITQIFVKLSKNTHNVSHKLFHNLQIPSLCGFITLRGDRPQPTRSLHPVYSKVTPPLAGMKIALHYKCPN
jgi:hypothetical protein